MNLFYRHIRNHRKMIGSFFGLALLVHLSACSEGKRPFKMAEICVQNEAGIQGFIDQLRDIARFEGMTFVDNSARTQIELEQAERSATQLHSNGRAVNVAVEGEGGLGLSVGNLGLPRHQMVLGFSQGADMTASRNFADRVIGSLSARKVVSIDNSQGAKPMSDCR